MSIWKHTFRGVLILANLIVGVGFLCCAYSPLVSPVTHPVFACAGLFFPFFLLAMLGFVVVWLFHCRKLACLPLAFLLLGGGAVLTYTPFKDGEDEADGEVMKFLTYNVMHMREIRKRRGILYDDTFRRVMRMWFVCKNIYGMSKKQKKFSQCIPTGVY